MFIIERPGVFLCHPTRSTVLSLHGTRGLLKVLDRELTVAVRVDQVVELANRRLGQLVLSSR